MSWIPDSVIAAKTVMVAPPSTGCGTVAIKDMSLGAEAGEQHNSGNDDEHALGDDLGGADESNVLAEGVGGQAADEGADRAADTLALDGTAELGVLSVTAEAAHSSGGHVADGLNRLDDVYEDHHDDRVGVELEAEVRRDGTETIAASATGAKSMMPPMMSATT